MSALAGLCSLCHLDLDLHGTVQVLRGDAEPSRCHLLDGGVALRSESRRILAALAGVGFSTQAVHGDCHGLMRLLRDRAVGHGTGLEAFDNLLHGLHFLERNRVLLRDEIHQAAQRVGTLAVIHHRGVGLELRIVSLPDGLLQVDDGFRIVEVILLVLAAS